VQKEVFVPDQELIFSQTENPKKKP